MTLRAYHLRLGGMAWAFESPAIPLPVSWLRFAAAPPLPNEAANSVRVRFEYAPREAIEERAGAFAEPAIPVLEETHPEGGWREEIARAGWELAARRDGAAWGVVEAPSQDCGSWRAILSRVDSAAATRSFFELLAPFLVGAEVSRRGGLLLHANALLVPESWGFAGGSSDRRPVLLVTGPSETGKSTLSRLLAREAARFELISEDRTILMPIDPGKKIGVPPSDGEAGGVGECGGFCAHSYPTSGEMWLRGARNRRKSNRLGGFIFPRRGNDNRVERLSEADAFPLLWEQALLPLYPKEMATKMVDTLLASVEQSPATAYAFMRRSQAAESLESVLGDIFGLRPLVEATRRRGLAPF